MTLSRNPSEYEYDCDSHAGSRKRQRKIPLDAIEHAIENGDAKDSGDGRVNFEAKWSGATFTVVVDPSSRFIITSYYGTNTTEKALDEAQKRKKERKQKINERRGAAYTGGWS